MNNPPIPKLGKTPKRAYKGLARVSTNPANIKTRKAAKKRRIAENKRWDYLESLQKQITIEKYGVDCYTCLARSLEGKNRQLGHVPWPRSVLSTACAYDFRYTRIQCFNCNINHGGMGAEATLRMQREGINVDHMWQEDRILKGGKYDLIWCENKIMEYESLLA